MVHVANTSQDHFDQLDALEASDLADRGCDQRHLAGVSKKTHKCTSTYLATPALTA